MSLLVIYEVNIFCNSHDILHGLFLCHEETIAELVENLTFKNKLKNRYNMWVTPTDAFASAGWFERSPPRHQVHIRASDDVHSCPPRQLNTWSTQLHLEHSYVAKTDDRWRNDSLPYRHENVGSMFGKVPWESHPPSSWRYYLYYSFPPTRFEESLKLEHNWMTLS